MTVAKPEIPSKKSSRFNVIWIVPMVAVILGAWVVVHSYLTEGPEIRITFQTAQSLEAGKTKIKFRNIEMGKITSLVLSDDMKGITAIAKMERAAMPLLGEDTKFWVVRANIGGGSISGLDTLLSGAYIQLSPAKSPSKVKQFSALEKPPQTPAGAPGIRLVLIGKGASSLKAGDPIVFKGYTVGRIEDLTLDVDNKNMRYDIFIDGPYDKLIDSSVRFWNISGISMSTSTTGLKISTGSLETIIAGGIAVGKPPNSSPGQASQDNDEFKLYDDENDTLETEFSNRTYYVAEITQSLKGLVEGSPVEYRGIEIGAVESIFVRDHIARSREQNTQGTGGAIAVLFFFEPGRAGMADSKETIDGLRKSVELGIGNGLRATLLKGNLLSGSKIIGLDYFPNAPEAKMTKYKAYDSIPTIETGLGELETKVSSLLDKMNNLPIEKTVDLTNQSLAEVKESAASLKALIEADSTRDITVELQASLVALRKILEDDKFQALPSEVDDTLTAAQRSLNAATYQLEGDSSEAHQLGATLKELEAAARSLREFLDVMERNPEALIRGKKSQ